MMTPAIEKKLLQCAIAIACIVPVSAGAFGMLQGAAFLGGGAAAMDSHFRYLSGLLFGIGIGFLSTIPHIEQHASRMRVLTFIVVTGGLARLLGVCLSGNPGTSMQFALVMELAVTPLLCYWQYCFAKRFS